MSRKIVPSSLRLQFKKDWKSQWMADKNNYAKILDIDLNIRKYISSIFNKKQMVLVDLSIKKSFDNFLVYAYINEDNDSTEELSIDLESIEKNLNQYLSKNSLSSNFKSKVFIIKVTTDFLKNKQKVWKVCQKLQSRFVPYDLKKKFVLFNLILLTQKPQLFAELIAKSLEKSPKHKRYLLNIKKVFSKLMFNYTNFKGYKIQIKGRINGVSRARKFSIQEGQIPLNTIKNNIKYGFSEACTPFGLCSVKIWFFFK